MARLNLEFVEIMADYYSTDDMQVKVERDPTPHMTDRIRLVITRNNRAVVRVLNLHPSQITVSERLLPFLQLGD